MPKNIYRCKSTQKNLPREFQIDMEEDTKNYLAFYPIFKKQIMREYSKFINDASEKANIEKVMIGFIFLKKDYVHVVYMVLEYS